MSNPERNWTPAFLGPDGVFYVEHDNSAPGASSVVNSPVVEATASNPQPESSRQFAGLLGVFSIEELAKMADGDSSHTAPYTKPSVEEMFGQNLFTRDEKRAPSFPDHNKVLPDDTRPQLVISIPEQQPAKYRHHDSLRKRFLNRVSLIAIGVIVASPIAVKTYDYFTNDDCVTLPAKTKNLAKCLPLEKVQGVEHTVVKKIKNWVPVGLRPAEKKEEK